MKTVKQACQLAPNALSIDVSDQVEQLEQLINDEGTGEAFYAKTFITAGMRDLLRGTIERLAGKSSNAVFHLKQAMGGGKTHLIVGTGLAAKHKALRHKYCADLAHIDAFETARVVAFNGRNSPTHYLWGEIAHQLGMGEQFKRFWMSGPEAPDESDWTAILKSNQPTLILLDELPPYFQYLGTRATGTGTVADIATRAFANLLSASGKLSNVCVVVSDLDASYAQGGALIERALLDARKELGRQEKAITPVDLAGNEVYDILRKRLFTKLPDVAEIEDLAARYGQALEEATKSKVIARGAEALADEIINTYPFHPRLKDLVALFKENEQFKQTRGLMELMSRLLKSVWERESDDVYLIGAQHFDLGITEVRSKLADISGMNDVISKDLWDVNFAAHAQGLDAQNGNKNASEVANLLFTASLSTAVNAVKGLSREEILECVVTPLRSVLEYNSAIDEMQSECWFLHLSQDAKLYFDRQENLTKMLQGLAATAPEAQIDELVKTRLQQMFFPTRKTAYTKVIALPRLNEVIDEVKRNRVLLIIDPANKMPPEALSQFFAELTEKNNLLVLTGDKTLMASIGAAARKVYATLKAETKIPKNHAQYEEFLGKKDSSDHEFYSTILGVFDKVIYPVQVGDKAPELKVKPLDTKRDGSKPFDGEEQIEKTLCAHPKKLFLDVEGDFDALRDFVETNLWNESSVTIDWTTAVAREKQKAKMPWMPPKGLDTLKSIALQRGIWEDLSNGHVSHSPAKKKTAVQVVADTNPDDDGVVVLRINALNAGPNGRIHYAVDGSVSATSPVLKDETLKTKAYLVQFLAIDPNGQFNTGDVTTWNNKLTIRAKFDSATRKVELLVAPAATLKYTLNGSEPRNGEDYPGPIELGSGSIKLLVFAEGGGLEAKQKFEYGSSSLASDSGRKKEVILDRSKPAQLSRIVSLGSRQEAYQVVTFLKERQATVEKAQAIVGTSPHTAQFFLGETPADGAYLENVLNQIGSCLPADSAISLKIHRFQLKTGQDLLDLAVKVGFELNETEFSQ
ncbi:anti-phage-associated DUF499 domain-containing protein [Rhodoferax ferrireducens]|uniref:anti-phage-associated DUF499 domain-containing protein n=1 Tax=Rhodoferax ferrireducens TaxID=192843 RepID=UPI000E0CF3C4|nr:anti-phage-associated DUF499 domain-containing protein [Rhodoferax ferrireducens]